MTSKFNRLTVLSAYQVLYRELRKMILSGALKAGDQLPTEGELSLQFGVNRSTVREGIRQLENEGLVIREGRKRLTVSVPDTEALARLMSRALLMHRVTFQQIWEVHLLLEPQSAALCALNRTGEQCRELQENIAELKAVTGKKSRFIEVDARFHEIIAEGSQNQVLLIARQPIGLLLKPTFESLSKALPQAVGRVVTAHTHIVDAIVAKDADKAETWMRRHVMDFKRGWELAKLGPHHVVPVPDDLA